MTLEQTLLVLLFTYFCVFIVFGLVKGRKYLISYSQGKGSEDYFFHSQNFTLTTAGLSVTAIALFVSLGLNNLEQFSSIILFFSISFVTLALSWNLVRFPRQIYHFVSDVLADVGVLAIGCGFLVFFDLRLPSSFGIIGAYALFIIAFLFLSFLDLHKYYRHWSAINDKKETAEETATNDSDSKKS